MSRNDNSYRIAEVNGDGRLDILRNLHCWDTPRLDIWLILCNPSGATGSGGKFEQVSRLKKAWSP
jgi:hypothetical protein